ncbi:MAG: hypothetical protein JOZ62_11185, partial [Acidobacteriaceae bacterium]|nr:hypothetical protein [Acidobacteriaceae bacterium]
AVTVGFQWYGGHREPAVGDINLGSPTGFLADGRPSFVRAARLNPAFNQILEIQPVGNSAYYGGIVALNKRFSKSLQFSASYTLGWAFNENDSVGDTGTPVVNPTNLHLDWGFSSSDQGHRFIAQGVWEPRVHAAGRTSAMLNGWTVAPNVTATSGFPFTATAGADLNGDGVNNDYPLYASRNRFRGPGFAEVNLRVSRTFALHEERLRLEIIGEAENLLNSTNAACNGGGCGGAVNTQYGSTLAKPPLANFGQIISAFNSRQIQIGAR